MNGAEMWYELRYRIYAKKNKHSIEEQRTIDNKKKKEADGLNKNFNVDFISWQRDELDVFCKEQNINKNNISGYVTSKFDRWLENKYN